MGAAGGTTGGSVELSVTVDFGGLRRADHVTR